MLWPQIQLGWKAEKHLSFTQICLFIFWTDSHPTPLWHVTENATTSWSSLQTHFFEILLQYRSWPHWSLWRVIDSSTASLATFRLWCVSLFFFKTEYHLFWDFQASIHWTILPALDSISSWLSEVSSWTISSLWNSRCDHWRNVDATCAFVTLQFRRQSEYVSQSSLRLAKTVLISFGEKKFINKM